MTDEQYELCSTDSTWYDKAGNNRSHSTFLAGMRGFAEDRKYQKQMEAQMKEQSQTDTENIIDF